MLVHAPTKQTVASFWIAPYDSDSLALAVGLPVVPADARWSTTTVVPFRSEGVCLVQVATAVMGSGGAPSVMGHVDEAADDTQPLYPPERQALIMREATRRGRVEVNQLARLMSITPETVRKDLNVLQRQGMLRRVHGGAVTVEKLEIEPAVDTRTAWSQEKDSIASAALAELPDGGSVFLESSTTVQRMAERLPADRGLTIVTNSLASAMALASRTDVTVVMIGGRIRPLSLSSVDLLAMENLKSVYVDVAFLGANGFSVTGGLTAPDMSEAAVKQLILQRGRRRVLLGDRSKYGQDFLCRYGGLEDIDLLISDSGLDGETADEIRKCGPDVRLV